MLTLYHGGGAGGFGFDETDPEPRAAILHTAQELLKTREHTEAAKLLGEVPFVFRAASNDFGDEFCVLHAAVPITTYERVRRMRDDSLGSKNFKFIADTLDELNAWVRFIAIEPATQEAPRPAQPLTDQQVYRLVHKYIGVIEEGPNAGYLVGFSYNKVEEFFRDLGMDVDPRQYGQRTRDRFKGATKAQSPAKQAEIVEAVLERFPPESTPERAALAPEIRSWLVTLRGNTGAVQTPHLIITSEVVGLALADAENLLRTTGAPSGVDRVHTALHGYLRQLCVDGNVAVADDADAPKMLHELREHHPALTDLGPRADEMLAVLRALAQIVTKLSPIRNHHSLAHPSPALLGEPEAMLVINCTKTILRYLDERVRRVRTASAATAPAPVDDYASFDDDIPF